MGNAIMWNKGEQSLIEVWLRGSASATFAPTAGSGNWGLGMGTQVGGVGVSSNTNKAKTMSSILELDGTGAASGYGRRPIQRSATGWPTTDPAGAGSWSATPSSAASFSFTGTPNPNSATLWFLAASQTLNADNALFGADLSATRVFNSGDTENITPTYKQT